jgi:hypothetical protein
MHIVALHLMPLFEGGLIVEGSSIMLSIGSDRTRGTDIKNNNNYVRIIANLFREVA